MNIACPSPEHCEDTLIFEVQELYFLKGKKRKALIKIKYGLPNHNMVNIHM